MEGGKKYKEEGRRGECPVRGRDDAERGMEEREIKATEMKAWKEK